MKICITASAFPGETGIDRVVELAASAGFDGVEWVIAEDGPLTFDTPEGEFRHCADSAAASGVAISGLRMVTRADRHRGSPSAEDGKVVFDQAVAALDRARWMGADTVIAAPATVFGPGTSTARVRYEDVYRGALEALSVLRFEAERRGVAIACCCASNGFLLSPIETREFIDRVNSPWVGVCLDPVAIMPLGDPCDWIRTLSGRIVRVCLAEDFREESGLERRDHVGGPEPDWRGIVAALAEVRYDGPVTVSGRGDAAEIRSSLAGLAP